MLEYNLEELFAKIPNELPFDENISNKAVALYYYIAECSTVANYSVTTVRNLLSHFNYKNVDRYYSIYIDALIELEDNGYIDILNNDFEVIERDEITKDSLLYINLNRKEDNYFQAYLQDVKNIMNYSKKNNLKQKENLIRYYLIIQRWTNYFGWEDEPSKAKLGRRIAYNTVNKSNQYVGIDANTFKKYNDILQELNIFYYDNNYRTKKLKNTPTRFDRCRLWNKQELDKYLEQEAEIKGQVKYDKIQANKRRSNTQKRNYKKKRKAS